MKRATWLISISILLAALLAGCAGEGTRLQPLDLAAWPTPAPSAARPTSTPFPKVEGSVRVVDDAVALATPVEPPATATALPASEAGKIAGEGSAASSDQGAPAAGAASAATVNGAKGANLRRGPGKDFPVLGVLPQGEAVAVLGLVQDVRDWALVQTSAGAQGWVSLPLLEVAGDAQAIPGVAAPPAPAASGQDAAAAPPAVSAVPAQGGVIVLQQASGGDILVANPGGSGLRRLTAGIDPVLSPDGSRVAFTRWNGEDGSLWVINTDGSGERRVAGGIKQAKHPTWSPDGTRVAVGLQHGGRLDPARPCVSALDLKGNPPDIPWNVEKDSVDVEIRGQYPYLLPYLCWTVPPDPHYSIRLVDVGTGQISDQTTDRYAFGPEWDPANPWRIVTSGFDGLYQMDINRAALWKLTDRREDHTPTFSPDGRYIAVAYDSGGHYDIHRLDAGGANRVPLTQSPLWLGAEGKQPWNNVAPAWSPDGSRVAFLTDRSGRWEVWVMNADGSDQRPLFPDAVNQQLQINYDFVDERMLSWGS